MNSPRVESSQRCVPPDWSISGRPVAMVSRLPANPENVTPRRRYLHCLLSIYTQGPAWK